MLDPMPGDSFEKAEEHCRYRKLAVKSTIITLLCNQSLISAAEACNGFSQCVHSLLPCV